MQARAPDLGVMLIAIARPTGEGPFPTVIVLHGTHGFAREYVQLARALAKEGVLAVVPCWFSGGGGSGARFVTPIPCTGAPPLSAAASATAQKTVKALVSEVRTLPDVQRSSVALFGHSLGGGTVLNYALDTGDIRAAVLDSAGFTDEQIGRIAASASPDPAAARRGRYVSRRRLAVPDPAEGACIRSGAAQSGQDCRSRLLREGRAQRHLHGSEAVRRLSAPHRCVHCAVARNSLMSR